jgi:hypothetical protein
VSLPARLAAASPAPVFVLRGDGAPPRAPFLPLARRLEVVASPRFASVLLVAGRIPDALLDAAAQVHDQLPHPRAVAFWGSSGAAFPFDDPVRIAADADPAPSLAALHRDLMRGRRASTPRLGPTRSPVEWRGVGPHGQGGEGMMGGTPYGRRMAMTGPDLRDALELDRVRLTVGPFLDWLPPGLSLALELQGDVVQTLEPRAPASLGVDRPEAFRRARAEPVPVAVLERARAAHLLVAAARLLRLHHLDALAHRTLRLAAAPPSGGADVRRLAEPLRRGLALALGGVGRIADGEAARGLGPAARAAGRREDARLEDPAYAGLGFEPVVQGGGDARARFAQWLDEAAQALDLAARAGERVRSPGPPLEGPRGPLGDEAARARRGRELLPALAVGGTFDALATTLVSLDLDAAAFAPPRPREAEPEAAPKPGEGRGEGAACPR